MLTFLTVLVTLFCVSMVSFSTFVFENEIDNVLNDERDADLSERVLVAILLPALLFWSFWLVIEHGVDGPEAEATRNVCRSAVNVILYGSAE